MVEHGVCSQQSVSHVTPYLPRSLLLHNCKRSHKIVNMEGRGWRVRLVNDLPRFYKLSHPSFEHSLNAVEYVYC